MIIIVDVTDLLIIDFCKRKIKKIINIRNVSPYIFSYFQLYNLTIDTTRSYWTVTRPGWRLQTL